MRDRFRVELGTLVLGIQDTEHFTLADRGCGLPDQDSVHDDSVTEVEILQGKFVFRRHPRLDLVGLPLEYDLVTRFQTHQGDRNIVGGANF